MLETTVIPSGDRTLRCSDDREPQCLFRPPLCATAAAFSGSPPPRQGPDSASRRIRFPPAYENIRPHTRNTPNGMQRYADSTKMFLSPPSSASGPAPRSSAPSGPPSLRGRPQSPAKPGSGPRPGKRDKKNLKNNLFFYSRPRRYIATGSTRSDNDSPETVLRNLRSGPIPIFIVETTVNDCFEKKPYIAPVSKNYTPF